MEHRAVFFEALSVLSILAEVENKFDVKTLFSSIFIKFGLCKDFEWPAQYFLEPSVTMILILVQKVANQRLISGEDLFFLEIAIILVQKVANWRLISGEDLFLEITIILVQKVANRRLISGEDLFFRDHYNFEAKSGVFSLYGLPIF